jgi:enoyl-CoA hydratase/carnithine racemase
MDTRQFAGLDRSSAREVIAKVGATLKAFRTAPVPTAILVEGYLLGAGFEMALAADFRVAVRGAKVGLPETKVGIPSVVDAALLQNYVGLSLAKEMVLIGDIYPVEDLPGFVNRYAEPGQLVEVAEKLLAPLAEYTPVVMKAQKELNEMWLNTGLQDSVERSIDVFADVFVDPSTSEAVHKYNARKKK